MSETAVTTTPETAAAPPDDFNAYEAWRAGQEKDETTSESASEPAGEAEEELSAADPGEETDTEGDEDEPGNETPDDDKAEGKPKRKGGYQRRIDKLTREKRELEERLARATSGGAGDDEGRSSGARKAEAAAADDSPKPQVEDFDSYEEFTEALTDWKLEQRAKADAQRTAQQQREQQAQQQQTERLEAWNERASAVRTDYPDFDATLAAVDDIEIPPYLQEALLDSAVGPALAYKLAKNPDELERIVALPATSAIRELGRLEASFEAPATKLKTHVAAKSVTRAPKPVAPLRPRGAATGGDIHDPALAGDYNAWEKARERQLKG